MSQSLTTDPVRAATLLRWTAISSLFVAVLMPPGMSTASGQAVGEKLPYDAAREINLRGHAPPTKDRSEKWFITVVSMHNCGACERLKYDFAHTDHLTPFVDARDHARSWSHYNVYQWENPQHRQRLQNVELSMFPTILIQPPMSGEYGDPRTVVWKKVGYNGNDAQLAQEIRRAITSYVAELPQENRVRSSLAALPKTAPGDDRQTRLSGETGQEVSW